MAQGRRIETVFTTKDWQTTEAALRAYGKEGNTALERVQKAAKGTDTGLKALNAASRELQDGMHGLAGRAGAVGSILSALGPKGLAVAAGIGAVALAVGKGLKAYAEDERAQLRFQAVLKATGNAAGVTAGQINELAERLERSTFFKKEDILQAAGALASFKAVSGDAFGSTIKLAADMAEVFGGDVVTNARTLGKAMQDPVDGLTALKRVAGELPPEVKKAAEEFEAAGQHMKAVDAIIAALNERIGGAAEGAGTGLAGRTRGLTVAMEDLLKELGRVTSEAAAMPSLFQQIADSIDGISAAIRRMREGAAEERQKLLADAYLSGNIPFPDDAAGVAAMRAAAMKAYPGFREDRPKTVDTVTRGSGYYFDARGQLHPPSKPRVDEGEMEKAAARRLRLEQEILDLEREHEAFARGGEKEIEVQRKLNQFLADTKGLREDEVKALAAKYEAQVRIAQADKEAIEAEKDRLREAERAAKRAAEEMARPFEHAYERMQDAAADWLSGEEINARTFVNIWKRAAAEMLAALVFRPMFSSVFGGLVPGISGSVTSGGLSGGIGGGIGGASGISSGISGLLNGFNTPMINPGIAFDIGSYLGLGGNTVGMLHSALGNFTPLAGLSSFGGSMLANLLGLNGRFSGAGGTLGGIAGTAIGGPIGGAIGSFLGSAVGGMFGGGTPHPMSSFSGALRPSGALDRVILQSKHMGTEAPGAISQQLSGFLQGLAQASGASFPGVGIQGFFTPDKSNLRIPGRNLTIPFNAASASSTAEAFRKLALYVAQLGNTVNQDLVQSLQGVKTQGRDAAAVLAAVTQRLADIKGFKEFSDALLTDPATTNLSPEELRARAAASFTELSGKYGQKKATAQEVQAAAVALLQASQGYAGRASGIYAGDLDFVRTRLQQLSASVPHFAAGGAGGPGWFVAGEQGPELVYSRGGYGVMNARQTREVMSGGNDLLLARALNDLKEMMAVLIGEQRATRKMLGRASAA